jgi:hypothetical protein
MYTCDSVEVDLACCIPFNLCFPFSHCLFVVQGNFYVSDASAGAVHRWKVPGGIPANHEVFYTGVGPNAWLGVSQWVGGSLYISSATSPTGLWRSDVLPPTAGMSLPSSTSAEATSASGAAVLFTASAADNGVALTVRCSPSSGSVFPLGTTTVICSTSDSARNTAQGTFSITVQDTTPPVISVPSDLSVPATSSSGASVSYDAVTALDSVSGVVTANVRCVPTSGSVFPSGVNTVQCSASDGAGNTATASFKVTVSTFLAASTPAISVATCGSTAVVSTALSDAASGSPLPSGASLSATFTLAPADTLSQVAPRTCSASSVGDNGLVSCSFTNPLPVPNVYTLSVEIAQSVQYAALPATETSVTITIATSSVQLTYTGVLSAAIGEVMAVAASIDLLAGPQGQAATGTLSFSMPGSDGGCQTISSVSGASNSAACMLATSWQPATATTLHVEYFWQAGVCQAYAGSIDVQIELIDLAATNARVTALEGTTQDQTIDAEENRAKGIEAIIQSSLQSEISRATAAETDASNVIAAEVTRARGAESALSSSVTAESQRAAAAESSLSSNLKQ